MPVYRVYFLEADGRIKAPPKTIDCADDDAAMTHARQFLNDRIIEVWKGARRISTLTLPKKGKAK